MEREVGGGIGMGNTCKPMAISFQCMTKFTTNKKKKSKKKFVPNSTSKTLHKYLIFITRKINTLWHTVTVELVSGN